MRMLNVKNVDVTRKAWREAFDMASSAYNNHHAMLSMAAASALLDSADMIEETAYYKGRAKQLLNRCKKWCETYWTRVHEVYGDRYALYIDYCNACVRSAEHDIRMFYFSIKSALDRERVKDSEVKAQVLMAAELIRVAATFHTDYWRIAAEKTGFADIGKPFWYADHTPLLRMYSEFAQCVCSQAEADVLDHDKHCRTGLRAILAKCENDDKLGMAAREAIMQNEERHPEWAEMVKELDDKASHPECGTNNDK